LVKEGHQDDVMLRAHHGRAGYTVFRRVALGAVRGRWLVRLEVDGRDKPCFHREIIERPAEGGCVTEVREPVWHDRGFFPR